MMIEDAFSLKVTDKPTIGVVILNYNDSGTTSALVTTISKYDCIDKIAIVDNNSSDHSVELLKELQSAKVDLLCAPRNGGYSYGNNLGAFYLIDKCNIELVIIANPDVKFSEEFLDTIAKRLFHTQTVAATGLMLDGKGNKMNFPNQIPTFTDDLLGCTFIVKKLKRLLFSKADKSNKIEMLPGSLFAIKADVFMDIGGFDENVFLFCEERILGSKLMARDYKISIYEDLSFTHYHSVSLNKSISDIEQIKRLYTSIRYFRKEYDNCNLLQTILLSFLMKYNLLVRKMSRAICKNGCKKHMG